VAVASLIWFHSLDRSMMKLGTHAVAWKLNTIRQFSQSVCLLLVLCVIWCTTSD